VQELGGFETGENCGSRLWRSVVAIEGSGFDGPGRNSRRQSCPASRTRLPAADSSGQPDKIAGGYFVRPGGQDCRRLFRSARRTGLPAAVSFGQPDRIAGG
jgi:hypothetical protein